MRNSISFFRVECHLFRNPVEMETKIECLFCTFFLYSVIIAEENENTRFMKEMFYGSF